jgi:Protein of unknown function (DUF1360)
VGVAVFRAYSGDPRPLRAHATLTFVFNGSVVAYALAYRRSRHSLPERVPPGDIALLAIGTYKLSRLIAKDRITSFFRAPFTRYTGESDRPSEVEEEPRGDGLRRAIGELVTCPYCLGQWVGTAYLLTYLRKPRLARAVAAVFTVVSGSDLLQEAWVAVDKRA